MERVQSLFAGAIFGLAVAALTLPANALTCTHITEYVAWAGHKGVLITTNDEDNNNATGYYEFDDIWDNARDIDVNYENEHNALLIACTSLTHPKIDFAGTNWYTGIYASWAQTIVSPGVASPQ